MYRNTSKNFVAPSRPIDEVWVNRSRHLRAEAKQNLREQYHPDLPAKERRKIYNTIDRIDHFYNFTVKSKPITAKGFMHLKKRKWDGNQSKRLPTTGIYVYFWYDDREDTYILGGVNNLRQKLKNHYFKKVDDTGHRIRGHFQYGFFACASLEIMKESIKIAAEHLGKKGKLVAVSDAEVQYYAYGYKPKVYNGKTLYDPNQKAGQVRTLDKSEFAAVAASMR